MNNEIDFDKIIIELLDTKNPIVFMVRLFLMKYEISNIFELGISIIYEFENYVSNKNKYEIYLEKIHQRPQKYEVLYKLYTSKDILDIYKENFDYKYFKIALITDKTFYKIMKQIIKSILNNKDYKISKNEFYNIINKNFWSEYHIKLLSWIINKKIILEDIKIESYKRIESTNSDKIIKYIISNFLKTIKQQKVIDINMIDLKLENIQNKHKNIDEFIDIIESKSKNYEQIDNSIVNIINEKINNLDLNWKYNFWFMEEIIWNNENKWIYREYLVSKIINVHIRNKFDNIINEHLSYSEYSNLKIDEKLYSSNEELKNLKQLKDFILFFYTRLIKNKYLKPFILLNLWKTIKSQLKNKNYDNLKFYLLFVSSNKYFEYTRLLYFFKQIEKYVENDVIFYIKVFRQWFLVLIILLIFISIFVPAIVFILLFISFCIFIFKIINNIYYLKNSNISINHCEDYRSWISYNIFIFIFIPIIMLSSILITEWKTIKDWYQDSKIFINYILWFSIYDIFDENSLKWDILNDYSKKNEHGWENNNIYIEELENICNDLLYK